jgi:hypothetical protein
VKSIQIKDLKKEMHIVEFGYGQRIDYTIEENAQHLEDMVEGYVGWNAYGIVTEHSRYGTPGERIRLFTADESGGCYAPDLYHIEDEIADLREQLRVGRLQREGLRGIVKTVEKERDEARAVAREYFGSWKSDYESPSREFVTKYRRVLVQFPWLVEDERVQPKVSDPPSWKDVPR